MTRIIVMGAGPIGGIVGGRLARAGNDVTLADVDAEHVAAIRERGLRVDVPDGSFDVSVPAIFPPEIKEKYDIGIIAVRSNYTKDALSSVAPHLNPGAILVSLQNGMNPPLLEEAVGGDHAVGAVVRMRSTRPAPGRVRTTKQGRLFIGHLHGKTTPQLETVHALLNGVIPTEITDNIFGTLWSKLTYSCLGMLGSLAGESLETICKDRANRRLFVEFFGEMTKVGTAAGVRFEPLQEYHPMDFHPGRSLEARLLAFDEVVRNSQSDPGAHHQLEPGEKTHVDYTVGYVVREGSRIGVPAPISRALVRMVHEVEEGKRPLEMGNYSELGSSIEI
jgi:2-dehydropantoate 2-reductase